MTTPSTGPFESPPTPRTVCQETLDAITISIVMGWSKKDDPETMVEYILMDPHWRLANREEALKFLGDLLETAIKHPEEISSLVEESDQVSD